MQIRAASTASVPSPAASAAPKAGPRDGYAGSVVEAPRTYGPLLLQPAADTEAFLVARGMLVGRQLPSAVQVSAVRDIASIPLPWLRRLDEEGLKVVVVRDGQSLADTEILPEMTPE